MKEKWPPPVAPGCARMGSEIVIMVTPVVKPVAVGEDITEILQGVFAESIRRNWF